MQYLGRKIVLGPTPYSYFSRLCIGSILEQFLWNLNFEQFLTYWKRGELKINSDGPKSSIEILSNILKQVLVN